MLHFADSGHGPPIVLLHGIPGSGLTWRKVARLVTPQARVIVPDLLGFGASPELPANGHAAVQAEAVEAMLDAAGVRGAHVVGFDFGGPVAVALYTRAPRLVSQLTLVAANVVTDNPVPAPLRLARVRGAGELLFRAMCSSAGLAAMWRGATRNRSSFPYSDFSSSIDRRGRATTRRLFLESIRHLESLYAPIESALATINVPATVVWGDGDPFFSVEAGRRTAARIRGARFIVIESCGHFVPEERPQELVTAMTSGDADR